MLRFPFRVSAGRCRYRSDDLDILDGLKLPSLLQASFSDRCLLWSVRIGLSSDTDVSAHRISAVSLFIGECGMLLIAHQY